MNLLSFPAGTERQLELGEMYEFSTNDVYLSYLPLAHIFERIVQQTVVNHGARVGFYQGDTLKLMDDLAELKPTIFASVPRLFNRIYDKILAGVKAKGGVAAALFNRAYATKKEYLKKGYNNHAFWDAIVFSKIKARLGGNVKFMVSGAAPISADVIDFMRICFCASFVEGYGQTETTGAAAVTHVSDMSSGHVGVPFPTCEIKLRDVPAMSYTSADKPFPRGEICIRGSNVFVGYYKSPEKTAEAMQDGWVFTGDIGMWDAQGIYKLIRPSEDY